jgi:two-component system, chemotaxis family, sensor kinase CheA
MENNVSPSRSAERTRLRTRLVRAMVGTLAVVSGATLLTVGYLNIRIARNTRDTIEAQIRQSITRKGQGLATNHALALRGLVADNAFGDVSQLVESAVRQDHEMVYGLFLGADGRPWTYVPPIATKGEGEEQTNWRELGIEPDAGRSPGPEARLRTFKGQMVFEFSASVGSDDGAILGRLFYGLSRVPLDQALAAARRDFQRSLALTLLLIGGLGIGAMLLGVAIIRNLSRRITEPLAHLTDVITAIAAGHKNERVSIESQDEIGALGRAFNRMLEKLDDSYLRLESLNRTLEQRVNERTEELAHRNRDMRLVLDNVNQGFLTISDRGQLTQERSAIIDTWFGAYETPLAFWDYMGRRDRNFAEMFQLGHEALVDDILPRQLCLDQLPTRLNLNGRDFSFSYRSIGDESGEMTGLGSDRRIKRGVLIVVNDITDQLLRGRQETEQAELLALFHGFTADRTGFLSFFEEATRILESLRTGNADLLTRKRHYHTLKGNAGLAGFGAIAQLCHEAEDKLAEGDDDAVGLVLAALTLRWSVLQTTLAELVRERGRDVIDVHARELDEVLRALRDVVPRSIWDRMADWHLEPAERPLARLAEYGRSLAKRLGRGDLEVCIESGGLRLDPQHWGGLWSELVHVIRNAVDHGLERIDERSAAGKPPRPRLRLATSTVGDQLVIEIEDDGRGIDWQAVERAARAKGLPCDTAEDRVNVLLSASLTTRDVVTTTSGRGIGLAAVRQRVDALGGRVSLETAPGQGTTFRLTFPLASPSTPENRSVARMAARVNPPAAA